MPLVIFADPRYGQASHPGRLTLVGLSGPALRSSVTVSVGLATATAARPTFQLVGPDGALSLELREVFPTVTAMLRLTRGKWADNIVAARSPMRRRSSARPPRGAHRDR